jgi:hypothetical protein
MMLNKSLEPAISNPISLVCKAVICIQLHWVRACMCAWTFLWVCVHACVCVKKGGGPNIHMRGRTDGPLIGDHFIFIFSLFKYVTFADHLVIVWTQCYLYQ